MGLVLGLDAFERIGLRRKGIQERPDRAPGISKILMESSNFEPIGNRVYDPHGVSDRTFEEHNLRRDVLQQFSLLSTIHLATKSGFQRQAAGNIAPR
jgi:hypothetical protein